MKIFAITPFAIKQDRYATAENCRAAAGLST
jgi:hypothetical protein